MTVADISAIKGIETVYMGNKDAEVTTAYTGDLLSDVMGNAEEGCVLITVQAHKNTIAVASLSSMPAIITCNGRECPQDMIEAAKKEEISLFTTDENQFKVSAKIAKALGC